MQKIKKKILKNFEWFLREFEPDPKPIEIWEPVGNGTRVLRRPSIALPPQQRIYDPYIIFIILCTIKKFPYSGKWEKTAWEIPIKYKSVPFILMHAKFGFRIESNNNDEITQKLGIEAISLLIKAVPYAELLIEPEISQRVQKGMITLDNQFPDINRRYQFFRKKALKELKKSGKGKEYHLDLKHGEKRAIASYERYLEKVNAINYYATAMLDAFFSLLEHLFVLLLPFHRSLHIENVNVEAFIGQNWKDKFKQLFILTGDTKALKLYEELYRIKEELRNPLTHGYFLKNGNSFYVHMDGVGAIPMTLTKPRQHIAYAFHPLLLNLKNTWSIFDEFMNFLETHYDTHFGMKYIRRGIEVAFDKRSSNKYKAAMTSDKKFEQFMKGTIQSIENAANMDW